MAILRSDTAPVRSVIEFDSASVVYPGSSRTGHVQALKEISLNIREGEFFSLIGPSGCGKSTLLNLVGGLHRPSTGRVLVNGQEIRRPRPETTAIVFQDYSLFPWRTVLRNVEAGLEFRGIPATRRREQALKYLRIVGLESFADAYPRQLSGGMKQRVSIARALSLETPVLLMDEPFGALDEQTRLILGEQLSQIFASTRKTILLVTHSLAEAVFLSDRIGVLSGRPGYIREIIDVPAPHPRLPEFTTSKLFHELRNHLFSLMHSEMRESVLGRRHGR